MAPLGREFCVQSVPPFVLFLFSTPFLITVFWKVLLATAGSTFLQNDLRHFALEHPLFGPPNGPHKSICFHFCSLLSLRCSFGSLFARYMCPSKKPGDRLSCIFRLQPVYGPFLASTVEHDVLYRMHFAWQFHMLAMLLSSFFETELPSLDVVPTPVADFALPAFFGPPAVVSPVTNGREHKLKGGGVPSPRGPSIITSANGAVRFGMLALEPIFD